MNMPMSVNTGVFGLPYQENTSSVTTAIIFRGNGESFRKICNLALQVICKTSFVPFTLVIAITAFCYSWKCKKCSHLYLSFSHLFSCNAASEHITVHFMFHLGHHVEACFWLPICATSCSVVTSNSHSLPCYRRLLGIKANPSATGYRCRICTSYYTP